MAKGKHVSKKHIIGEAGSGHTFTSEAEGPIAFAVDGEKLPLFKRTIFAEQVGENIMSVSEAVDKGYTMLFNKEGVTLYHKDVKVRGDAVLSGKRDLTNNLFYIDLPSVSAPSLHKALCSRVSPFKLVPVEGVNNSSSGSRYFGQVRAQRLIVSKCDVSLPGNLTESTDLCMARLVRTYHEFKSDYELWHPRLAHINVKLAKKAKPDMEGWSRARHCDGCVRGKFHKHPHSGSRPPPGELPWAPGENLTCDLFGPLLRSGGGASYVGFYLDIKSRFVYAKLLVTKTSHYQALREVIQDLRARSGNRLRYFKLDGDGIFHWW
jgi:hypothetical protein